MTFNELQIERYARHIILPEVGGNGQKRLLNSRVLVVGAGGLGSPLLMYLAAAGVGKIGVIDDDRVSLSNLQRQIIHNTPSVGISKVLSASRAIESINPDVNTVIYEKRLTAENAIDIISDYDLVADGSDNFETRFLINDASFFAKKTLVSAAILRFDGQLSTYKAYLGKTHPCYRCIFREPPPSGLIPSCSEGGILGVVAGSIGSLQSTEVLKELLDIGKSLSGTLVIYDALSSTFRNVNLKPDPDCPLCGSNPKIKDLSQHL